MWGPAVSRQPILELANQILARALSAGAYIVGAYSVGAYSVGAYSAPATDFGAGKSDTS